jgi:hypothetical protein
MFKATIGMLAGLVTTWSSVALAGAPGKPAVPPAGRHEKLDRAFQFLDANGDGKIDRTEFEQRMPLLVRRAAEQAGKHNAWAWEGKKAGHRPGERLGRGWGMGRRWDRPMCYGGPCGEGPWGRGMGREKWERPMGHGRPCEEGPGGSGMHRRGWDRPMGYGGPCGDGPCGRGMGRGRCDRPMGYGGPCGEGRRGRGMGRGMWEKPAGHDGPRHGDDRGMGTIMGHLNALIDAKVNEAVQRALRSGAVAGACGVAPGCQGNRPCASCAPKAPVPPPPPGPCGAPGAAPVPPQMPDLSKPAVPKPEAPPMRPARGRGGPDSPRMRGPVGMGLGPGRNLIDALDTNHDGKIDQKEISEAAEALRKLDLNRDGVIDMRDAAEAAREVLGNLPGSLK